jgi:hypothetical protein
MGAPPGPPVSIPPTTTHQAGRAGGLIGSRRIHHTHHRCAHGAGTVVSYTVQERLVQRLSPLRLALLASSPTLGSLVTGRLPRRDGHTRCGTLSEAQISGARLWDTTLMPLKATIVSEQQITVPIPDSGGARTLLITTTGLMEIKLVVNNSQATESYSALLKDPVPGQFRRAIATASIAGIEYGLQTELNNNDARWLITNATAHLAKVTLGSPVPG